jgi:hypothetical protein
MTDNTNTIQPMSIDPAYEVVSDPFLDVMCESCQ